MVQKRSLKKEKLLKTCVRCGSPALIRRGSHYHCVRCGNVAKDHKRTTAREVKELHTQRSMHTKKLHHLRNMKRHLEVQHFSQKYYVRLWYMFTSYIMLIIGAIYVVSEHLPLGLLLLIIGVFSALFTRKI